MALDVDPSKERTIVVLTKLDLSHDNNAYEALKGEKFVYELGVIGVVNRSDDDIKENKSYQEVLEKEREVLLSRYQFVASRNGILYLIDRLCDQLFKKVSDTLPKVKVPISILNKCLKHLN